MDNLKFDPWHYPRHALAKRYLDLFDMGLVAARGVFAKRRMGKTEFFTKDLIPLAESTGYLTAYANLWEHRFDPARAVIDALAGTLDPMGITKPLNLPGAQPKKSRSARKMGAGGSGKMEPETFGAALADVLRRIDQDGRPLLLVIDETQVLGEAGHAGFTYALRTALDVRRENVKVIFASSTENTLRRMFARSSEPFYNWAPLEPFDLLGDDFVADMVRKVNDLTKFPLAVADAKQAYSSLQGTPAFFRCFLIQYLTHAQLGPQAVLELTKAEVFNDIEFYNYWKSILPADREILRMLAEGLTDLHSKAVRARLGTVLGLDVPVSLNTPQQALRRLQADSVVARLDHGEYHFEDDAFAYWVGKLAA